MPGEAEPPWSRGPRGLGRSPRRPQGRQVARVRRRGKIAPRPNHLSRGTGAQWGRRIDHQTRARLAPGRAWTSRCFQPPRDRTKTGVFLLRRSASLVLAAYAGPSGSRRTTSATASQRPDMALRGHGRPKASHRWAASSESVERCNGGIGLGHGSAPVLFGTHQCANRVNVLWDHVGFLVNRRK